MTPALPPEMWHKIFSYLDVEDLAKARRVSREWWDVINTDRLWKPLLIRRGIITDFCTLQKEGDADTLQCCEWAQTCSTYYNRVSSNWRKPQYRTTNAAQLVDDVFYRLPYLFVVSFEFVDVYRLVDRDFMLSSRLPLPDAGEDECDFFFQMTTDTVFVISKNTFSLIFKLNRVECKFEKAVCITYDKNFVSCAAEEEVPNFLRNTTRAETRCWCATDNALWIAYFLSGISLEWNELYVWNYHKSEVMFQFNMTTFGRVHPEKNFVYGVRPDQLSVHSPNGHRLFLYKRTHSQISRLSWGEMGCGFIEKRSTKKFAIYWKVATNTITYLRVVEPEAITVDETLRLAYCWCVRDGVASMVTASLETGAKLKETVVHPALVPFREKVNDTVTNYTFMNYKVPLHSYVVLGKYIAAPGFDAENPDFSLSKYDDNIMSLYSLSEEKFLWSHRFSTDIMYFSDQFVITVGDNSFEIHNFL